MKKWNSVTPFLKEAHFLPVKQRIDFKIGLTTYKCLNNVAPKYLSDCIKVKSQPKKTLRTDNDYFLLDVPQAPNLKRTERSFKLQYLALLNGLDWTDCLAYGLPYVNLSQSLNLLNGTLLFLRCSADVASIF
jgi:hypothetical protein